MLTKNHSYLAQDIAILALGQDLADLKVIIDEHHAMGKFPTQGLLAVWRTIKTVADETVEGLIDRRDLENIACSEGIK